MPLMPVASKPVASPVASVSLPPAPDGMNVNLPANEIADTEAAYLQDILLDQPGFARRRGPITPVSGAAALPREGMGLAMTLDPQGAVLYGILTGDTSGYFTIYNAALSSHVDIAWPFVLGTNPYPIVDAGAALYTGTMVGTSSAYDANSPSQALAYWAGGTHANYTTGTITVARGSTTVTGTGTAFTGLTPGMWLFANTDDPYTNAYVGMVKSITNDSTIVLAAPSPYAITGKTYTLQSVRGVYPKVSVGTITGSGTTLTGGDTKFEKQGLGTGSWDIYRASDMAFVGHVASVQSDIGLTLSAAAAVPVADDAYVALRADGNFSLVNTTSDKPGFLTAVYSNRQWYANNGGSFDTTYRLWFSDTTDPEILDMTQDGNWIPINSTGDVQEPIIGLASAYNSLVVLKETEAFAVLGTDPTSFTAIKIADDGALSPMSVQQWGGGVLWTGRDGVHFFDGTQDVNLTAGKFGIVWHQLIESFDPATERMWAMVERDHYILHIEGISSPLAVVKGNTSTTPNHWVLVINLNSASKAPTLWQNVKLRGAVTLPASLGHESRYLYNDGTKAVLAEAGAFFDIEGNDPAVEGVTGAGPDFYFLSKRIDGGSPTRLKRFTYFILSYLIAGDALKLDTVLGLNNLGSTATTDFPATVPTWNDIGQSISSWAGLKDQFATWSDIISAVFVPDRMRFLKKSQFMQFRLWQASSSVSRLKIGDFELGFKPMRMGRI